MTQFGVFSNPIFGIVATVGFYAGARKLQARWSWLHPLFLTAGGLIVLLELAHVPYRDYKVGGDMVALLLAPATVALAVPLYRHARQLRRHLGAIALGIMVGAWSGIWCSAFVVFWLGGSREVMLAMMPKSVTTAISIEIARELGQRPELTAVFTVLTGLLGSMIGPELLRRVGVRRDLAIGIAVGTAAHGIGTARVINENDTQGSAAAFAMSLSGVIVALMFVPIVRWLG